MEDDDGRRRRLSRRRLSSCSHGNVGTRPISRSYGLLDDNVFSLAAANGWLPPSDLPTRIPFLSHPAHWDACTHAGAGAHDPDADPAATDATFDTAIAESAVADDALLATATAAAATDTAELITIATTWPAPSRTSARPRRGGMRH